MARLPLIFSLLLLTGCAEQPIREGYAETYSLRGDDGVKYVETAQRGITLSDTHDPKKLAAFIDVILKERKPFYIRVYKDHILVTNPASPTTERIELKNLDGIEWKK